MRLIDANALEDRLRKIQPCWFDKSNVLIWVKDAQSIDVESIRPKGEWVIKEDDISCRVECSLCREETLRSRQGNRYLSPYCPNCGARMEIKK